MMHLGLASRAKFNCPTENRNLHRDKTTKIRIYCSIALCPLALHCSSALWVYAVTYRAFRALFFPLPPKGAGNCEI